MRCEINLMLVSVPAWQSFSSAVVDWPVKKVTRAELDDRVPVIPGPLPPPPHRFVEVGRIEDALEIQ